MNGTRCKGSADYIEGDARCWILFAARARRRSATAWRRLECTGTTCGAASSWLAQFTLPGKPDRTVARRYPQTSRAVSTKTTPAIPSLRGPSRLRRPRLSPDFAGRLDDEPQLGGLLVHGECVALHRRRKTALRTQAELLERNESRRFVDPPLECVLALDRAALGSHQPQHHHLALGHEPQRLETARALVVVFEKETVDVQPAE